jgi:hypothetical protein
LKKAYIKYLPGNHAMLDFRTVYGGWNRKGIGLLYHPPEHGIVNVYGA